MKLIQAFFTVSFPKIIFLLLFNPFDSFAQNLSDTLIAQKHFEKAESLYAANQLDSSSYYYLQSYQIYEKMNLWEKALENQRLINYNLSAQSKTQEAIRETQLLISKCQEKLGNYHLLTGTVYYNLGNLYAATRDFDLSFQAHNKALELASYSPIDKSYHLYTSINIGLGYMYLLKGWYSRALESYLQAVKLFEQYYSPFDSRINSLYNDLAVSYLRTGNYDLATQYLYQELNIRKQKYGSNSVWVADVYYNLSICLNYLKEYQKSEEYLKLADTIYQTTYSSEHIRRIDLLNAFGTNQYYQKNYPKASQYYSSALSILEKSPEKYPYLINQIYENIASINFLNKNYPLANTYYQKVLKYNQNKLGDKHPATANTLKYIGDLHYLKTDYDSALYYLQKSIIAQVQDFDNQDITKNPNLNNFIFSPIQLLRTLAGKAATLKKQGEKNLQKLDLAWQVLSLSDSLIQNIRQQFQYPSDKIALAEITRNIYLNALEISEMTKNWDKFFFYSEKIKANLLQDFLAENAFEQKNLDANAKHQIQNIKDDIAYQQRQIVQNPKSPKVADFRQAIFQKNRELANLRNDFAKKYPDYKSFQNHTKILNINELRKNIKPNTLILSYILADEYLYINLLHQQSYQVKKVKIDEPLLQGKIRDYYALMVGGAEHKRMLNLSKELYDIFIKPLLPDLQQFKNLCIVPDKNLYLLPFETLISNLPTDLTTNKLNFSTLPYLIQKFDISYYPSVNLLLDKTHFPQFPSFALDFQGFAPVFDENSKISSKNELLVMRNDSSSERGKLAPLKESRREIITIDSLIKVKNLVGKIFLKKTASEENFKTNISTRYLHLATHSLANENYPNLSGVILTQPDSSTAKNKKEDGILYLDEILNLRLQSDLVVLSSCQSGIGKYVEGEGPLSLIKGFMSLGVPNVVSSLWNVNDKFTADLMIDFYQKILNGQSYTQALNEVKRNIIKKDNNLAPKNWAGFLVMSR